MRICIALLCLFSVQITFAQEWQVFHSSDNLFSVSCPGGIMNFNEKKINSSVGVLENQVYYLDLEDHPNHLYMISLVKYPEGALEKDSIGRIEEFLIESCESLALNTGYTIKYRDTQMENTPYYAMMRMYNKDKKDGVKVKALVNNDILYIVQVYSNHPNQLNDFMERFIQSFKLN